MERHGRTGMEGNGEAWKAMVRAWTGMEGHGKGMEGHGRAWKGVGRRGVKGHCLALQAFCSSRQEEDSVWISEHQFVVFRRNARMYDIRAQPVRVSHIPLLQRFE